MEGYYWRLVDAEQSRVLVVLCGVCRGPSGRWALVCLAAHPGAVVRHAITSRRRRAIRAASALSAGALLDGSLRPAAAAPRRAQLGGSRATAGVAWPRRAFGALGAAHLVPGLAQYWHPVLLDAEVSGEASVAGAAHQPGRRPRLRGEELGPWLCRALVVGPGGRLPRPRAGRGLRRRTPAPARR